MEPKAVHDDIGAQQTIRETQDRRVPDELMQQLHEANQRADALRQELDATLGDNEFEKAQRTREVGDRLREAERVIETINGRIHAATPSPAK